VIKW